jgi:hypothetical protein
MAQNNVQTQLARTQEALKREEQQLLALPNVVGVGVGYKETKGKELKDSVCVNVYVRQKFAPDALPPGSLVPDKVDGVKTDVREVGDIVAQSYTARIRPAKPGYSIGHYKITAGTFGCLVRDTCGSCRIYILSNNHVLANSNAAASGDPILQPGRVDGGSYPKDLIARLARFIPIRFNDPDKYNLVDAAIASPLDQRDVIASIVGLGIPTGSVEAKLGMPVQKSGRTTQTTSGKVIGIDATIAVGYGTAGVAYFRNQILTTNMSQGGDSGSLLLDSDSGAATGLLFAGSSQVTVHNAISNVLMALGVELVCA